MNFTWQFYFYILILNPYKKCIQLNILKSNIFQVIVVQNALPKLLSCRKFKTQTIFISKHDDVHVTFKSTQIQRTFENENLLYIIVVELFILDCDLKARFFIFR